MQYVQPRKTVVIWMSEATSGKNVVTAGGYGRSLWLGGRSSLLCRKANFDPQGGRTHFVSRIAEVFVKNAHLPSEE